MKIAEQSNLTPADIKSHDQQLVMAVSAFNDLVQTYMSDRLLQLKRRDSSLNV